MNRQELIQRLVERKLQTPGATKAGCVPCFGAASKRTNGRVAAKK